MEPTVRFELTTYGLQNRCSNQLSYVGETILWWAGQDSNLRRRSQQIYSLPSLTA